MSSCVGTPWLPRSLSTVEARHRDPVRVGSLWSNAHCCLGPGPDWKQIWEVRGDARGHFSDSNLSFRLPP